MAPVPHPLAGKSGEGPPIAPPNWKWRAGNRISDMYFYSPSGKQFRSRPELANYLQTLNNPPDTNMFCWRVTDEVLKNGFVPRGDILLLRPAKRMSRSPAGGGNKRMKISTAKPLKRPQFPFAKASIEPTPVKPAAFLAPCHGPNLRQKGTTFSSPTSVGLHYSERRDRKKGKRVGISVPHSFKSILAGRSSFTWLYDSDTLERFLEEARRLKDKSVAETTEIRNVLLHRHLDTSNICKYPNSVIRVFVRLLRNEEAPASMGKTELAHLCVNWKCKKRHYWCLLEVGCMNLPRKFAKVDDNRRGCGLSQSKGSFSHSVGTELGRKYSDNPKDDKVMGYANGLLNQPGVHPRLGFRLPGGSGKVVGDWKRPLEPTKKFQPPEGSISSPSQDLDTASVRKADLKGLSLEELALAPSMKVGDGDTRVSDPETGLEAGGLILLGENLPGSEEASLRVVKRKTAVNHGNDTKLFRGIKDRTQRKSGQFPPNSIHEDRSWDNAVISKAIAALPLRVAQATSEEPAPRTDHTGSRPAIKKLRQQAEELVPQIDSKSVLLSGPSPDLYGESIIVITGFKSCTSKGTGIVYHGDEAVQLQGGSFAVDSSPSIRASKLPSTSYNGCKPSEMHSGASAAVINALDSITQRNRESGLSFENGDLTRGFPAVIKSDGMEWTLRRDKHVSSREPGSDCNGLGLTTNCLEPENRWSSHKEELQRSGSLAWVLDDCGDFVRGDLSQTIFSSDGSKLRMVTDPESSTLPANADGAGVSSKDLATLLLSTELREEPLASTYDDASPAVTEALHIAHVSELLAQRDGGTRKELFNTGIREKALSLTPKQDVAPGDTSACWCNICGSDFSFCRGCMCSFCREILVPGEDWKVVACICTHMCHMDCALAANAAGVVKELGLDGELSCPSCSRKVDLWLFFQKRFDLIFSLSQVAIVNLKGLEKLLLQALQLLKGTKKVQYKSIEGLVIESYELIRKFPVLGLVQNLLRAVRDELRVPRSDSIDGPRPDAERLVGGRQASATPEEIHLLKNELLARESFDNARNQRLLMEQVVDKVHRAYEDALNRREQARSSPRAMIVGEPQVLQKNVIPPVPEELIISQQDKVDHELKKLWDLRKFEVVDFTTISVLDASSAAWIENLKLQRVVVEEAQARLQHLKNLNRQSIGLKDFR